jgi:hypothetical protein
MTKYTITHGIPVTLTGLGLMAEEAREMGISIRERYNPPVSDWFGSLAMPALDDDFIAGLERWAAWMETPEGQARQQRARDDHAVLRFLDDGSCVLVRDGETFRPEDLGSAPSPRLAPGTDPRTLAAVWRAGWWFAEIEGQCRERDEVTGGYDFPGGRAPWHTVEIDYWVEHDSLGLLPCYATGRLYLVPGVIVVESASRTIGPLARGSVLESAADLPADLRPYPGMDGTGVRVADHDDAAAMAVARWAHGGLPVGRWATDIA